MSDIWTVPAKVLGVIDGDTLKLHLSLGWHIYLESRVRLVGINCPEIADEAGQAAKSFVVGELVKAGGQLGGVGTEVTFVSHALDKYGRPLGQVLITTQQGGRFDLGESLIAAGHAVPMR